ncbi:hypothetical protein B0J12DRAFT_789872 [Macrophomina phaseolina]|uniref:DUF7905 domain-containing protein n=1 Tax=Macrophomina phaseolina TaxID=35725 RepID=A0ABQ8FUU4_9PEZI|nr:hypothetical protein B0J12DRAFT_789872 [Macrophomina phaseolina]
MPDIVVALPKDLNFAAALSESRSSSKPVLPRVQEIAIATGTYINPIWGNYKGSKTVKLLFYGTPEATESARKLVSDWIQELKDQSDEKWAKVWAYNTHDEKRLRKRLIKNTERQRYCKALTENDQVPTYSLTFPWPLKREPEKVLGPNYEALDPIRMDCQSWVAREKHPGPAIFKIQGHEEGRVQDALKRMQNIPRSFDAKIFEVEPFTIIDVPPSDSKKFPPVIRIPYHPPRPLKDPSDKMEGGLTFQFKYPLTDTWALQDVTEPDDFPDDSLEDPLALQLLNKVIETTQHARYFNGLLRMNIHLGTFVAQKAWDVDIGNNAYKYFTFADMIKGSEKMEARVSAEIGDPIMESHVLARCFEGKKILAPQDPWTRRLSAVKPIYAATFEIATTLGQGDLILDVELSCEGGTTNVLSKRWYRLRENKSEPRKLLDGSILNLENGLAWQIRLDQYVPVDELNLSRDYYIFPDTLTLDINAAEDLENHNFVVYRSRHDRVLQVPIQSVRQKRLWRFNTKAGEWVVEVGKVDKTVFIHGQPQCVFEPRWTLNLSHNKWDELLALNKRIEVGQSAAWGRGNPANLLFPRNQDMSFITGLARQDMEESDDESEQENDDQENSAGDKEDRDTPEEQASVQSFQDLLDLLRQLADLVSSKA